MGSVESGVGGEGGQKKETYNFDGLPVNVVSERAEEGSDLRAGEIQEGEGEDDGDNDGNGNGNGRNATASDATAVTSPLIPPPSPPNPPLSSDPDATLKTAPVLNQASSGIASQPTTESSSSSPEAADGTGIMSFYVLGGTFRSDYLRNALASLPDPPYGDSSSSGGEAAAGEGRGEFLVHLGGGTGLGEEEEGSDMVDAAAAEAAPPCRRRLHRGPAPIAEGSVLSLSGAGLCPTKRILLRRALFFIIGGGGAVHDHPFLRSDR